MGDRIAWTASNPIGRVQESGESAPGGPIEAEKFGSEN